MKILYIHPESYQRRYSELAIPVGIIGLINLLIDNKFIVTGINLPLEKRLQKNFNTKDYLTEVDASVVLIDLHWYVFSYNAIELIKKIKKIKPEAKIVLGGITASIYGNEIMEFCPEVDFIVKGDSEQVLVDLMNQIETGDLANLNIIPNLIYRAERNIIENKTEYICVRLDNLNYWNLDWLKNRDEFYKYQAHMELCKDKSEYKLAWIPIARGCKHNCSYCGGNHKFFKDIFKYLGMKTRSTGSIVKDIKNLTDQGVNIIGVTHDLSIFGPDYWKKLFSQLDKIKNQIGMFHYCYQLPGEEFIDRFNNSLNQHGSVLGIPVISGDENIRFENGKYFTTEGLLKVVERFVGTETVLSLYFIDNAISNGSDSAVGATKNLIHYLIDKYQDKLRLEIGYGFELLQPYSALYNGQFTEKGYKPLWTTFADIYNRFSPEFSEELKNTLNIESIFGHTNVDKKVLKRYKYFNNLIKANNLNHVKEY